ncbi:MAG: alkyl sulfatase dimerization domain-containing protein [Promethearchaeia archaeon]
MTEKKAQPMAITQASDPEISHPLEDVHTAALPIAGMAWIDTNEGIFMIDTLLTEIAAKKVIDSIKDSVKFIVYTHGHMDHVGGAQVFMEESPEVIGNKYLPERFDKYINLAEHRSLINAEQFNIPRIKRPVEFVYPTKTFLGDLTISLGDKTFELHTCRAETDDAVWVHVPELNAAFIGDLMIGRNFPNVGNPHKPTRFALDWAKELERIRDLKPKYVFCNGAGSLYKEEEVDDALSANIEAIRDLHDQVIGFINEGIHITEMIHKVELPEHLEESPYLQQLYSRPEFFTFNVYRWYHGYYDHNPAHLIPRPEKEVMGELYNLIGGSDKILDRVRALKEQSKRQLALQILDVLIQAKPENKEALKLRMNLTKELARRDTCLMSRNAYLFSSKQDKRKLRKLRRKSKKS